MVPLLRRVNDLHLFFIPSDYSTIGLTSNSLWTYSVFRFLLKSSQACQVGASRRREPTTTPAGNLAKGLFLGISCTPRPPPLDTMNTHANPQVLAQSGTNMSIFARLDDRTAVVTGASTGIGRAIALELARAGANVVIHYAQNQAAAGEVVQQIHALGRQAHALAQDFQDESALPDFVERAWNAFGQFHLWVNNAGVDLLTGPEAEWDYARKLAALWMVDVRATILLSKLAGARLQAIGEGVILNIGWDQADSGMEGDSGELFAAAKGAIMSFTRSLAVSLAPQVRVNCIAPGWIRTAWGQQAGPAWQHRVRQETPLRRWGEPEDVARLARFLLSPEAAYLTGQVIYANGGAIR